MFSIPKLDPRQPRLIPSRPQAARSWLKLTQVSTVLGPDAVQSEHASLPGLGELGTRLLEPQIAPNIRAKLESHPKMPKTSKNAKILENVQIFVLTHHTST